METKYRNLHLHFPLELVGYLYFYMVVGSGSVRRFFSVLNTVYDNPSFLCTFYFMMKFFGFIVKGNYFLCSINCLFESFGNP